MKKLFLVLVAILIGCESCGSGTGESPASTTSGSGATTAATGTTGDTSVAQNVLYLASNVLINSANASQGLSTGKVLDSTTQVPAENIVVSKDNNSLESENLQDALDEEIAPTLSDTILGTWNCVDRDGVSIGTIRFGTDFNVPTGHCLHMSANGPSYVPGAGCWTPISYSLIENSIIRVSSNGNVENCGDQSQSATSSTYFLIISATSTKMVLWAGSSLIFVLTK